MKYIYLHTVLLNAHVSKMQIQFFFLTEINLVSLILAGPAFVMDK